MRKLLAVMMLGQSMSLLGVGAAAAQGSSDRPSASAPAVITQGSRNTSIGGLPAARKGDATDGGAAIEQGSPNVFINGKPAATVGDRTGCGGVTIGGAPNVFINGKPVVRTGDLTSGCPRK